MLMIFTIIKELGIFIGKFIAMFILLDVICLIRGKIFPFGTLEKRGRWIIVGTISLILLILERTRIIY